MCSKIVHLIAVVIVEMGSFMEAIWTASREPVSGEVVTGSFSPQNSFNDLIGYYMRHIDTQLSCELFVVHSEGA